MSTNGAAARKLGQPSSLLMMLVLFERPLHQDIGLFQLAFSSEKMESIKFYSSSAKVDEVVPPREKMCY